MRSIEQVVLGLLVCIQLTDARQALPVDDDDVIEKRQECVIDINEDVPKNQPLYVWPGTERFALPSDASGRIYMDAGHEIELYCDSDFEEPFGLKSIVAQCVVDRTFSVNEKMFQFSELGCRSLQPFHVARPTGIPCYGDGSIIRVGFEINVTHPRFFPLMEVCFDQGVERTHYVHHELTPANIVHQSGIKRIGFYGGPFFTNPRMNTVYSQYKQREKLSFLLGSTDLAESLIREKSAFFLARGHLAPKADFIMGLHQRATFQFINAAPQWQIFNSQNWERIETGIRELAGKRGLKLDIITGTYDTLALPDINGTPQDIYLSHDINNNPTVPVPKFYYKIVLNRKFNSGLAIIGVNNPYVTGEQIETGYLICDDISEQVTWLMWDRANLKNGYLYACDVNQLLQVIKHLPPLDVHNLLL